MTKFFLSIYDFLSRRKALAALLLAVLLGLSLFFGLRMDFEEDISKFLPSDPVSARYSEVYEAMSTRNNIMVLFTPGENAPEDPEERKFLIEDAMDAFGEIWEQEDEDCLISEKAITVDEDSSLDMIETVEDWYPLFMRDEDYRRIDSLLSSPGYVRQSLEADYQMLLFPTGEAMVRNMKGDPLHLFTPVLSRVRESSAEGGYSVEDGYLFTSDGYGLAFLTSPYGTSESSFNGRISAIMDKVTESVSEKFPDVKVSAVGPPLIAASNAAQIKKDSIIAILVAIILIGFVLFLSYRRFSDIAWIIISTAVGWLFAFGLIAILRDSMSIIVLGIGSIIIGIAVNYPLHYVDGLKSGTTPRENLREMVVPLLIGNITTVAAFLCLLWMDAAAMRDLGLFGSLMLVGTIIFVLVFLPVFSRGRKGTGKTVEIGRLLPETLPFGGWALLAVALITVGMVILSKRTTFDSNMQNINYMTAQQSNDLQYLQGGTGPEGSYELYAVAEGENLSEAIKVNDRIREHLSVLSEEGKVSSVKGIGDMIPSEEVQAERIAKWNSFWGDGKKELLVRELEKEASEAGFSQGAFSLFSDMLSREYTPQSVDSDLFAPAGEVFRGTYILSSGGKVCVLSRVGYDDPSMTDEIKSAITSGVPSSMSFGTSDISNQLAKVLSESFDWIGAVCGLVVFIFLCISMRRLELAVLSFLPLAFGWYWILGTMGLFGIKFNIVNVILATFIFGQGDDYTIFITEGLIYEYAYGKKRLSTYRNSVVNSAIIMFIGIGALILAKHPAMKSLAQVTMIGMFFVMVFAFYLPPVIFKWLTTKDGKKRDVPITFKRLIYTAFALTVFALTMLLFMYPYTFFYFLGKDTEERRLKYHAFLQKLSKIAVSNIPGVKFKVKDEGNVDFSKPSVIICNHQSHVDIIALMALHPKMVFLTNDWAWNNPFYGYVIRKAEFYPASDGMDANVERIRGLVSRGYSVVIFPEGTRSADCSIARFRKGAFMLAGALGVPVRTMFLHGPGYVLPKKELMLREGEINVEVGQDYKVEGDYHAQAKSFTALFRQKYSSMRDRIETPEYVARYVRYKYIYKGTEVERNSRKALRDLPGEEFFAKTDGTKVIDFCGQGEHALVYALVNRDVKVIARDPSAENIDLCRNISNLPENIVFERSEEAPAL